MTKLEFRNFLNSYKQFTENCKEVFKREYPEEMVERSVWGMLPKGRLGRQIAKKLVVYKGANHKHEAQKPEVLEYKK